MKQYRVKENLWRWFLLSLALDNQIRYKHGSARVSSPLQYEVNHTRISSHIHKMSLNSISTFTATYIDMHHKYLYIYVCVCVLYLIYVQIETLIYPREVKHSFKIYRTSLSILATIQNYFFFLLFYKNWSIIIIIILFDKKAILVLNKKKEEKTTGNQTLVQKLTFSFFNLFLSACCYRQHSRIVAITTKQ